MGQTFTNVNECLKGKEEEKVSKGTRDSGQRGQQNGDHLLPQSTANTPRCDEGERSARNPAAEISNQPWGCALHLNAVVAASVKGASMRDAGKPRNGESCS